MSNAPVPAAGGGLWAELRRRNVIRVAGLYIVGAWLLVQVAETLLPIFGTPGWVLQALVVLLALGLVPALVVAWVFELTPEGIRRDSGVEHVSGGVDRTARKLDIAVIVLLLGLGALMLWGPDRVERGSESISSAPASGPASPGSEIDSDPLSASDSDSGAGSGPDASVAVLAFANMSPDADNEYFADGIAEELLNVLARIDGLRVASRTSAFSFKGKDTPIPEIARLLDVRHVLEGSVRKQGQRVRITAQLIDSHTDGHVWTQTYDRELADIFAVQEEIARAIAGELEGMLGRQDVTVVAATASLDAYEMFLRGRVRFHQRRELDAAIDDLGAAVAKDPQFAEAWVYLAAAQTVKPGYEVNPDLAAADAAAAATLEQARRLAPRHPLVLGVQAHLLDRRGDQVGALALLGEAAQLSNQDSTAVMWFGSQLLYAGYIDEARAALERAVRMDPRVGINLGFLAIAYLSTDQLERAEDKARQALELGWPYAEYTLALELAARGDLERATAPLQRSLHAMGGDNIRLLPALQAALADPQQQAAYWALRSASSFASDVADESIAMDRPEILLDRLQRVQQMDRADRLPAYWLRAVWLPSSAAVREDPRFFAFAEDHGLVRLWETRGYPPGCQRVGAAGGDHLDCPGMRP